jgi:hypothetical protein
VSDLPLGVPIVPGFTPGDECYPRPCSWGWDDPDNLTDIVVIDPCEVHAESMAQAARARGN